MCPESALTDFRVWLRRRSATRWGVSRPVGRVLCARLRGATVIHLGLPLPTASCGLPASIGRAALERSRREPAVPLLTLLRVGFTEPPQSPAALVVSYTAVSPLPRSRGAVCFLWHCPAGHPGSALPTTLPCGARTFLAGPRPGATARPTHPHSGYGRSGSAVVAEGQAGGTDIGSAVAGGHGGVPLTGQGRQQRQVVIAGLS
jgi:hypothetical protein